MTRFKQPRPDPPPGPPPPRPPGLPEAPGVTLIKAQIERERATVKLMERLQLLTDLGIVALERHLHPPQTTPFDPPEVS